VLELTSEGKRVIAAAFRRHAAELRAAMAILNDTEKRQLYGLLKKLGLFAVEARAEAGKVSKTTTRKGRFRK
jgi:hypothetical protein